ncbi:hypothetical protein Hanom_Chr05g00436211 [Helianthus anomalus]
MQFNVLYVGFYDIFDSRHLGKYSGPLNHIFALYSNVKKLKIAEFWCFLQSSAVLVCSGHFSALKLSLGRQFYDLYFPTHYSSVTLCYGLILCLNIMSV